MKLDKNQQKQLINAIHVSLSRRGYKEKTNSIYKVKDNAFIHCDFLVVNSQKLIYRIYVKNYIYDDIFWKVMQMPTNSKKNDSLRACGAFKAPSILLNKGEFELTDKFEEQAEYLLRLVDECSHNFMEKYDIDEYIIDYEDGVYKEMLKCLAYIHMNNIEEAIKIAQDSINNGNKGNHENGGKAFFEWILMLCKTGDGDMSCSKRQNSNF